jgi:hypothetical protein
MGCSARKKIPNLKFRISLENITARRDEKLEKKEIQILAD